MKKIILLLLMITNVQFLSATLGRFLLNRSGKAISVEFMNGTTSLFGATNLINVPVGQMIIIPATSLPIPGSSPVRNYPTSATGFKVTVDGQTIAVTIPDSMQNASYLVKADPANAGKYTTASIALYYDITTGARDPNGQDIAKIGTPGYEGF